LVVYSAERVAVGLDARDGALALAGWREQTDASAAETMTRLAALGVGRFIFTDIARDGALTAPNFEAVEAMAQQARALSVAGEGEWRGGARLIASGGVASIDHLRRLASIGVEGVIMGSAIYEQRVNLAAAVAELASA
ncbi:MAG: HisA/HisF-related TIM barrel protein, partial [Chloroflexota bacterium]|nr:HisA/HisF-related TIM barrel protein [Chloroflexota bacterium]